MSAAIRPAFAPFGWSVALHAALAGLLLVSLARTRLEAPPPAVPIDAVIVDQAVLQAVAQKRSEDERRRAQQADLRRESEAAAAKAQQEESRRVQLETDRRVERERQLAAEQAARQKAKAAADARRKAEEDAKRKTQQRAQAATAVRQKKTAEEARLKAEREAELRARLAEEEQRTSAAYQGLKAEYIAAIQAHVERRWFRPPGTRPGVRCTVQVTQIPGGEVVAVRFGTCDGGEALRQSIETAVRNASPLPPPPEPTLFEREVRLVFKPEE